MPAISIVLVPDVLNADGSGMYYGNANQVDSFTIKNITPGHYRAYALENVNTNELQDPDVLKQGANLLGVRIWSQSERRGGNRDARGRDWPLDLPSDPCTGHRRSSSEPRWRIGECDPCVLVSSSRSCSADV